jgi:tetratricopeptide (TPR) repeat protein
MFCARLLFLLVVFITAVAQQPPTQLDKLRAEGYRALFNLDYETARRNFQKIIELAPDDPVGPECIATSLWIQQLNESWRLKSTLYNDKIEKAAANEKPKVDQRQIDEFHKWTRLARQLAEKRLRQNARDVAALYQLGAAEGLEAAYGAGVEHKYMAALRTGSSAVDHHRQVLELSPKFYDAELTIGLQDYVIGSLPLPTKMLAGTFGVHGSRKRGLKELEQVAREGQWARDVARMLLIDLYQREKRWDDAIATARELSEDYPRNYLFKQQLAAATTRKAGDTHKPNK